MPIPRTRQRPRQVAGALFFGAALALLSLASGCGDSGDDPVDQLLECAELRGALAEPGSELAREVERVRLAQGLPKQLFEPSMGSTDAEDGNAAVALGNCFGRVQLGLLNDQLDALAAISPDGISDGGREAAKKLLAENAERIECVLAAGRMPWRQFRVNHRLGHFAAMPMLDEVQAAVRLLLLDATHGGAEAWPAAERIDAALGWTEVLSRVPRIESRVLAANLRAECLEGVRFLLERDSATAREAQRLEATLRAQLAAWPGDERMLVGDRAATMHAYEALRLGMLNQIITPEERKRLIAEGKLVELQETSPALVAADELIYLRAMAPLVAAARDPYHTRGVTIERAMRAFDVTPAPFAKLLFAGDLVIAQRLVARDRARCETWSLALATAVGIEPLGHDTNPATGEPYELRAEGGFIRVLAGDDELLEPVVRSFE
ncbi:hypothetical protein Mal64_22450 [Pseudobythopirellula maris]|uniref:Uncharacterized protein n=1 Tax=Pseudobythopirellula maris TaxID=2527991 RepID=A0A5C5ZPE5_9BACT|nr:hypothetical protein [Pseudobythopirellula maris]TWT88757.1 hypothetical protein Mal64_22450 [Pseudobythopirellula maris]